MLFNTLIRDVRYYIVQIQPDLEELEENMEQNEKEQAEEKEQVCCIIIVIYSVVIVLLDHSMTVAVVVLR